MKTLNTTVEINGTILKIEQGRVFTRAFGTTINNHSMHWSWIEININDLKGSVRKQLKERNLI